VPEAPETASPSPVDEGAEAAFLAEARGRGETFGRALAVEPAEETNGRDLPPLDELVQKIPVEVRETLDELFRAKFVAVRRVPSAALKR
jgi:hypothetical protein